MTKHRMTGIMEKRGNDGKQIDLATGRPVSLGQGGALTGRIH